MSIKGSFLDNIKYNENLNNSNLYDFHNNKTNNNNGFSEWVEENTCVFCVATILLAIALFIFISLIIVRLVFGKKKITIKKKYSTVLNRRDILSDIIYDRDYDLLD